MIFLSALADEARGLSDDMSQADCRKAAWYDSLILFIVRVLAVAWVTSASLLS